MWYYWNLIEAEKQRIYFPNNRLPINTFYKLISVHRTEESLKFLQKCDDENLTPKFLEDALKNVQQLGLKPAELFRMKKRKLLEEKHKKLEILKNVKFEFESLSNQIQKFLPDNYIHRQFINFLKNLAKKSELKSDMIRDQKLRRLSYDKKTDYNRIQVHNRTNVTIPREIIEILELGKNRGVGSDTDLSPSVFTELDKLFEVFEKEARKNEIKEIDIAGIKANSILNGINIANSKTYDPRIKTLKFFLRDNPELVLLSVDKQADLIFLTKTQYHEKLESLLNQNFKKVDNFKSTTLETILQDFRKLLTKTFSGCLPIWKIRTFFPANSLSSFYGTVKLHKSSEPLRGIATSYDSLVNNAEKYVNKLIKPLLEKC